jgi:serine phosphatase RsbU (regulator of sigma subunit)/ligand-binding sensor domain-containing protein
MMQLNRILALSFLFIWLSIPLLSQHNENGIPILNNYHHSITGGSEQNWCITQDARGVMYIGNNDKGVLEYDGKEWRSIPLPGNPIVRSMVTGDDGVVYVGAESEFGYLALDGIGNLYYQSLSDTIDQDQFPFAGVWRSYFHDGKVYFCTFTGIFIYNSRLDELSFQTTPEYAFFSFLIDSTFYIGDYGTGLMRLEQDRFVLVKGGEAFKELSITGLAKFDFSRFLVGTMERGLFLFNTKTGEVDQSFPDPEVKEYISKGMITYIKPLNEDFIVSNLYNGIVILDRNGAAKEIISRSEGMIDENIPFVYSNDQFKGSGALWIPNYMGVTKLETNIPFRQFTESSGFKGFITDIEVLNDQLYISTFSGLYYRSSSSSATSFIPVPGIHNETIRNLNVFKPNPNVELLIASSERTTYVIDKKMNVSSLADQVVNPHPGRQEREEYSGQNIVVDPKHPDILYTGRLQIVGLQYSGGSWKEIMRLKDLPGEHLRTMTIDKYGYLWASTARRVMRIDISHANEATLKYFFEEDGLPVHGYSQVFIDPENEEVIMGTNDGFYKYNYFTDTVYRDTIYNSVLPAGKNQIMAFHKDQDDDLWYSFENEFTGWKQVVARKAGNTLEVIHDKAFQRLPNESTDVIFSDPEQGVWFGKSNVLYNFDKSFSRDYSIPFQTLIRKVIINNDSLIYGGANFIEDTPGIFRPHPIQAEETHPLIKYKFNNIRFIWAAPFFEQEDKIMFSYKLEGFTDEWSDWVPANYKEYTNLDGGTYTLYVKAKNIYGVESNPAKYIFKLKPPWYLSAWAYVVYILLFLFLLYFIYLFFNNRRLMEIVKKRTKEVLEQKRLVTDRNEELEQLNEEVSAQRDEIEAQRDQLVVQRDILSSQNKEITDSIRYAQQIQSAILPSKSYMDSLLPEYFIFYKPRDIVSGDFYWIKEMKNHLIIVGADCTGHGIPGAFMSMLGVTLLNDMVGSTSIDQPAEILGQLRVKVKEMMAQEGKMEDQKDGMDMTIVIIHRESHELQFAGAYNPLYIIRKKESEPDEKLDRYASMDHLEFQLFELKADKQPVGTHWEETDFTNHTIQLQHQDAIYIFSDGMIDQFGGEKHKKFKSRNFKNLLLSVQEESMEKQKQLVENTFETWRGDCDQIDDVCVIGVRI